MAELQKLGDGQITAELVAEAAKLRKNNCAENICLIIKGSIKTMVWELEDTMEGVSPEEIAEELDHNPRFLFYCYKVRPASGASCAAAAARLPDTLRLPRSTIAATGGCSSRCALSTTTRRAARWR